MIRSSSSSKSDLHFDYDAMGQRICKIVKPRNGSGVLNQAEWTYTYYVRDAAGNTIAVYDRDYVHPDTKFYDVLSQKENHLYGSSRVGVKNDTTRLASQQYSFVAYNADSTFDLSTPNTLTSTATDANSFVHEMGRKSYELVNHLGNVLVTVSDMRTANNSGATVTGWNAVVNSATDYYAFGSPMEGRTFSSASYRYGQNGQEKDDEIANGIYTTEFWEYDSRLGRRWNTDPVVTPWESAYAVFNNSPLKCEDHKGKFPHPTGNTNEVTSIKKNEDGSYTITEITIIVNNVSVTETLDAEAQHTLGYQTYNATTIQTKTIIYSTTTIDKDGNIVSNSATKNEFKDTYYDVVVRNPYDGNSIVASDTHPTVGPNGEIPGSYFQSTSQGNFVGPLAQLAQESLNRGEGFPIMSDAEWSNSVEFGGGLGPDKAGDPNRRYNKKIDKNEHKDQSDALAELATRISHGLSESSKTFITTTGKNFDGDSFKDKNQYKSYLRLVETATTATFSTSQSDTQ